MDRKSLSLTISLGICILMYLYCFSFSSCLRSHNIISIKDLDSSIFRRYYPPFDSTETEGLSETRDPNAQYGNNIEVQARLNKLGLLNNDSLVLSKFNPLDSFTLKSDKGDILKVHSSYSKDYLTYYIKITDKERKGEIEMHEDILGIKFALTDFIPGGFPEIIVLRNYYIMNGDNYYIHIYQVIN